MKVTILGNGSLATAFARAACGAAGIELVQIYARGNDGRALAESVGAEYTDNPSDLLPADLYIISVSDSGIAEVASKIVIPENAAVVHTAGGLGLDALPVGLQNRGVLYPLQTFTKYRTIDFRKVPLFIEYSSPEAEKTIRIFAESLEGVVMEANTELRNQLHVAAVFSCNFTNYMYSVGAHLMENAGLPFDLLGPLIEETAAKAIASGDPSEVQTGPAVRGDEATMERHREILRAYGKTEYLDMYNEISKNIWETLKKT